MSRWLALAAALVGCRASTPSPSQRVLVAARALEIGQVVSADAVEARELPISFDTAGALRPEDLASVLGAKVKVAVPEGRALHEYWFEAR